MKKFRVWLNGEMEISASNYAQALRAAATRLDEMPGLTLTSISAGECRGERIPPPLTPMMLDEASQEEEASP